MRNTLHLILLSGALFLTGCALVVVGAGVGIGAYSYVKGELKRSYPDGYEKTVAVCKATLEQVKMPLEETLSDGFETTLKARRADDTPVIVRIKKIDEEVTEVGVRCGVLGVWDRRTSEMIHGIIAQRLQE